MRINPNTANSASKSHPSKPAEQVVYDPAFSFFAQIDQIQKLQSGRDSRPDANSRDKNPDEDGDLNLLSAFRAPMLLPLEPFLAPDEPGNPVDPPANGLCESSGSGVAAPNSLFAAVAAQSMIGVSFAALPPAPMQNLKDLPTEARSSSQIFDNSVPPASNGNPSELPGLAGRIESVLKPGAPATDEADGQNPSPQLLSNGSARVPEKTMDRFGAPTVDQNPPPGLSDGVARIPEKAMDLSGTPAVEQNPSPQLLSNGIAHSLEKTVDRSSSQVETDNIPELGTGSQSDRQRTRVSESRQPRPILTDPETQALFSKIATISAPDRSGNSVSSPGTAEARGTQTESYVTTAPIKANTPVAPQNDAGAESQKNFHPRQNEAGVATVAQTKLNAVQAEVPLAKAGTNGNRQQVFSPVPTNAPSVDSTLSPPSSSAPEPARPQSFIFQIAERIQIQVRAGGGEIRIQLKPDGLGQLEIKAETTINGVAARISTDSDGVKSYLENNLHLLQQTLQDQGLRVDRIYVAVQTGSDDQSSSSHTAQFSHAGQGQHGRESHNPQLERQAGGSDVSEEMAVDPATWLMLKPNTRFYTVA